MIRKSLLTISIIMLSASLFAEVIKVTVLDRDLDMPLEGVQLLLVGKEERYYTNFNGEAVIQIPESMKRCVLLGALPGYENFRIPFDKNQKDILVEMILSGGVVQGQELVVERSKPGETDEETGISVVVEAEEMETTANIGLVEDVMSAVKTLPGVGYTDGWNAQPSIRGGYPEELSCALDGFYVTYPYHWGGGYSIFNPNMVETAKLSHGIYSAKYGRAMSGLLEITTKDPMDPEVHVDGSLSTTSTDLFVQTPLGSSAGLFLGGKLTYLDMMKFVFPEETKSMTQMPYIRDLYTKAFIRPASNLELYLNGFVGFDGLALDETMSFNEFQSSIKFNYVYANTFISAGLKWNPNERFLVHAFGGYNLNRSVGEFNSSNSGSREYSDEFLAYWESLGIDTDGDPNLVNGESSYSLDGYAEGGEFLTDVNQYQGKIEMDYLLGDNAVLAFGAEEILAYTNAKQEFSGWDIQYDAAAGEFFFVPETFNMTVNGNKALNSAAFLVLEYGNDQSAIQGELGIRGEHFYLWNDDFSLNTYPVANPRASINWTPIRNTGRIDHLTFSAGSGLFSSVPFDANVAEEKFGLEDFEFGPDQAIFNVIGSELMTQNGWKIKAEAYYKHYLQRLVVSNVVVDMDTTDYYANMDGKGWAAGADLMIQKKMSRYIDGYLTYSYIYSRFYNPSSSNSSNEELMIPAGEPIDEWYYPYYHRFHNMNLVVNIRPTSNWIFTISGSFATGAPKEELGDVVMNAFSVDWDNDGSIDDVLERYARSSYYSDSLRNGISIPVDVRIAYKWDAKPNSKVLSEMYLGVEDIFVNLYKPSTNSQLNPVTGEEQRETSADFNLGIPIISFGYKLSY